jgi:hypothetical protein
MSLREWRAAAVTPSDGPPDPDQWSPVEVPGRPAQFAGADAVAYRTTFDDPRSGDDVHAVLELRGLFAHARIWLNGEFRHEHDAYFEPVRLPFDPEATNELVVECRAPEDRFGGMYDTSTIPDERCVPGIWWDVHVETVPAAYIGDVQVRPRLTDDGAAFDVQTLVTSSGGIDDRLTYSLRPEGDFKTRGMMERSAVEVEPGERTTVTHTIQVREPEFWWPRGYGPQHRYTVRVKLTDEESRTVTTGLRSVEYGDDGLVVNGRRIPARGVNLLDGTIEDVERAVDLNANLVRAHAHVLPEAVYAACNEAGLLVWQDLPLTGPEEFDAERGKAIARAIERSRVRHPSLAAFGVHDDPRVPFDDGLGTGVLDKLIFRWRVWRTAYDHGPADEVATALPDPIPTFPVAGPPGTDPDAAALYPGWDYGSPGAVDWLIDAYPRLGDVVVEFGAGSLGRSGEMDGVDQEKLNAHHGGSVEASQEYQTTVLKTVAERLRTHNPDVLAAFTLRDAKQSGLGILETDGTKKQAYDALADSYQPIQAVLTDDPPGETDVSVINDTNEAISGTLGWRTDGEQGETAIEVPAHDSAHSATVDVPESADRVTFRLVVDDTAIENEYKL